MKEFATENNLTYAAVLSNPELMNEDNKLLEPDDIDWTDFDWRK